MSIEVKVKYFEDFLEKNLRPDYLKVIEKQEQLMNEIHEYEILLISINKIQEANLEKLVTRVNLGHHIFTDAEIEKCDKVIVKMLDDLFVELPLPRASNFIEEKIKILTERCTLLDSLASRIRAHIDIVLDSLGNLQNLRSEKK